MSVKLWYKFLLATYEGVSVEGLGTTANISRNIRGIASPEPDFDGLVSSLHRVKSSTGSVECGSVTVIRRCLDVASVVTVDSHVTVQLR